MATNLLVAKIWSFCDTLRDDGLGYGDYLEQLTYLLFLKMADENKEQYKIPANFEGITFNKLCNGLTSWSFKIPTSAYCHRWQPC